ncbi:hypothetical protein VTP01DRAFT_10582 [Rhizomucor pusillus]|uniref:uncharacterized protein n=1 Tax=Rhizomucor pusillus TaxID=4840 RepID=UPI0037441081
MYSFMVSFLLQASSEFQVCNQTMGPELEKGVVANGKGLQNDCCHNYSVVRIIDIPKSITRFFTRLLSRLIKPFPL